MSTLHDYAAAITAVIPGAEFTIGPGLDYLNVGPAYCAMDITRATEELGYLPEFDLVTGVADYIAEVERQALRGNAPAAPAADGLASGSAHP